MEEWKDIEDFKGKYQISNYGSVRNVGFYVKFRIGSQQYKKPRQMKLQKHTKGYITVNLSGKFKRVNRLVAIHFIPNPLNFPIVLHLDNDPNNNHFQNLKWGTNQDNMDRRNSENRQAKGQTNGRSKLTDDIVKEIRYLSSTGVKGVDLTKRFGISSGPLSQLLSGKNWKHVPSK